MSEQYTSSPIEVAIKEMESHPFGVKKRQMSECPQAGSSLLSTQRAFEKLLKSLIPS